MQNKYLSDQKDEIDIILVQCPPWDIEMPPLGLAYLSSNLVAKGFTVKVLDLNIDLYNKVPWEFKKFWSMTNYKSWNEKNFHKSIFKIEFSYLRDKLSWILEKKPLIVGFNVNTANYHFAKDIAKIIKKRRPDILICGGGPLTEDLDLLRNEFKGYFDLVIIGEGEILLPYVLDKIKNKKSLSNIPGVFLLDNKYQFIVQKPTPDINELSSPTFKEFDLSKYKKKELPILASRGCNGRCSFCYDWKQRKHYISRPAKIVVDEIISHVENYGIYRFNFRDLLINGDLANLERICDLIISHKLKISWCGQGTVNLNMSNHLLKKMKTSGFSSIVLGVESGSDKILKEMNKPFRRKHLNNLLPRLQKYGINVHINIIVGYPGEGVEEFADTCKLIYENRKHIKRIASLNPCFLISGTSLTFMMNKYNLNVPKCSSYLKWYSRDKKNNYKVRKRRLNTIVQLCKAIGIKTPIINLYDEKKESSITLSSSPLLNNIAIIYLNSAANLFVECLKEHSLPYTLGHTLTYIGNEIYKLKNEEYR